MLPRGRGTAPTSPVGRAAVARPPRDAAGPRRQGPRGPGAGPLRSEPSSTTAPPPHRSVRRDDPAVEKGSVDTNQGLPGGPHRLRPATADDIGGRPGAVNSNTGRSTNRPSRINTSDYRSSLIRYRPSTRHLRYSTRSAAQRIRHDRVVEQPKVLAPRGPSPCSSHLPTIAAPSTEATTCARHSGRARESTTRRARRGVEQQPAPQVLLGGRDPLARGRPAVVQQQRGVDTHPPQHRQDRVEPLGELDRRGARRPSARTPAAHGPQPGPTAVPSAHSASPSETTVCGEPSSDDPQLDAPRSRRPSRRGCTRGGGRGRPRAPPGAAAGSRRAPRAALTRTIERRSPAYVCSALHGASSTSRYSTSLGRRAGPGSDAVAQRQPTARGRRGPAARAGRRRGGGERRAAPPSARHRAAGRPARGAPRGRRPARRARRRDPGTRAPPGGTARAGRPAGAPATRARPAARPGSVRGAAPTPSPAARPRAAPPAGPARRPSAPARSRPHAAIAGVHGDGCDECGHQAAQAQGQGDVGARHVGPARLRRHLCTVAPAHPVTRGAHRRKVAPSSE